MKITVLRYRLYIQPPIFIGSGIKIGNLNTFKRDYIVNDKKLLIPGNTLRGLIGKSLLKLFCKKIAQGGTDKLCTEGSTCPYIDDCPAYELLLDWSLTRGAIYHFGHVETRGGFKLMLKPQTTLDRERRVTETTKGPYYYELLYPLQEDEVVVHGKVVLLGSTTRYVEHVRKAILCTQYMSIGGRRTQGCGLIKKVEVENPIDLEIDKYVEEYTGIIETSEVRAIVETPIPLPNRKIENLGNYIEETLREEIKVMLGQEVAVKVEIRALSKLITIAWWNEAKREVRRALAIAPQTEVSLKSASREDLAKVLIILDLVGLVEQNQWYTKCGYGVVKPKTCISEAK